MSKCTATFIIAIVFIPTAVFSLAYYFTSFLKTDISEMISDVENIEKSISDKVETGISAEEFVKVFNEDWKRKSEKWCFFFDHESIHQIDFMRAELEAEVGAGEYNAARITAARIKCAFEMLQAHDSLNVSNFF